MHQNLRTVMMPLLAVVFSFFTISVQAQNVSSDEVTPAPAVTSDKDDYAPGEIATITGTGWQPGETVFVEFKEEPDYPDYHRYNPVADEEGSWVIKYDIEERHLWVKFTVLAIGQQSGYRATTLFTDGSNELYTPTLSPNQSCISRSASYKLTVANSSTIQNGLALKSFKFTIPNVVYLVNQGLTLNDITVPDGWTKQIVRNGNNLGTYEYVVSVLSTTGLGRNQSIDVLIRLNTPNTAQPVTFSTTASADENGNQGQTNRFFLAPGAAQPILTITSTLPAAPTVAAAGQGDQTVCSNGSPSQMLTASASAPSGSTLVWYTGPSGTVTTTTPTQVGEGTVTYYAASRSAAGCESLTRTAVTLAINAAPAATLNSSDADNTICAGESVTFTAGAVTNATYEFFVNGTSAAAASATRTFTTTTLSNSQIVSVRIITNGCSQTSSGITTTVNPQPTDAVAGTNQAINSGNVATLAANTPAVGTGSWSIERGGTGTFSNVNSPVSTFTGTPGATYVLRWTISTPNCGSSSSTVEIKFNQLPTSISVASVTGTYGGNVILSATLKSGSSYVSGKTINFTVTVGDITKTASATTDANGNATTNNVSLEGVNANTTGYPDAISASFAAESNYSGSSGSGNLVVAKASTTTVITVAPGTFTYIGTPITPATVRVTGAGGLDLTPAAAYSNNVNAGTATASFSYVESANHLASHDSKFFTIGKASATINVVGTTVIYNGSAHGATGTATGLNGETLAGLNLGNSFTTVPGGTANWTFTDVTGNYNNASGSVSITISKAMPVITWNDPSGITYGTALSVAQLNASASVAGTLTYTPDLGTYLNAGKVQTLSVRFAPTDANNYNTAASEVNIDVAKANATILVNGYKGIYNGAAHGATLASATGARNEDLSNFVNLGTSFANVPGGTANWSFAGDDNHNASNGTAEITISKAPTTTVVTIAAGPFTFTGSAITPATVRVTGAGGLDLTPGASYTNNVNAGIATASYTYAERANYLASQDSKEFTIRKANLIIKADDKNKQYGAAEPALTWSVVSGLLSTDTRSVVSGATLHTVTGAAATFGTHAIDLTGATAANYNVEMREGTLSVAKATLTITNTNRSKTYGQTLANADFTGTVTGLVYSDNITVSRSSTGSVASAAVAGSPYLIVATPADPGNRLVNYSLSNIAGLLTVTAAPTVMTYTGTEFINTASSSASSVSVPISVVLTPNNSGGYISTATVQVSYDLNTIANPVTLKVNADGTASGLLLLNIGSANSATFELDFVIGGNYSGSLYDVLVTVSKPLGDFITGGGHLKHAPVTTGNTLQSGGRHRADPGTSTNFGFNVKFNKSGTNLQGSMNVVWRSGNKVYQLKTNSMSYLGVTANDRSVICPDGTFGGSAVFEAKGNLSDITNPATPISLGGNQNLRVTMKDKGEPGKDNDMIAITITDGVGALVYASNLSGTRTAERTISGGNLSVKSNSTFGNTPGATNVQVANNQVSLQVLAEATSFDLKASPNPTIFQFTLKAESNVRTPMTLLVRDNAGKLVEVRREVMQGQSFQLGASYPSGMYYAELIQGANRKVVKLVKNRE